MEAYSMDLAEVTRYAALRFTPEQTEALCGLVPGAILTDPEAEKAYILGRLKAEAIARQVVFVAMQEGDRTAAVKFLSLGDPVEMEGDHAAPKNPRRSPGKR